MKIMIPLIFIMGPLAAKVDAGKQEKFPSPKRVHQLDYTEATEGGFEQEVPLKRIVSGSLFLSVSVQGVKHWEVRKDLSLRVAIYSGFNPWA